MVGKVRSRFAQPGEFSKMTTPSKMIRTLQAQGEDGNVLTIIVTERQVSQAFLSSPPAKFPGQRDYRLEDGRDVERIDDDTFKIIQTDEILRVVRAVGDGGI